MTLEVALLARAAFVRPNAEHLRALLPRFLTATGWRARSEDEAALQMCSEMNWKWLGFGVPVPSPWVEGLRKLGGTDEAPPRVLLFAQIQLTDNLPVAVDAGHLEVIEQPSTLADELQEATS